MYDQFTFKAKRSMPFQRKFSLEIDSAPVDLTGYTFEFRAVAAVGLSPAFTLTLLNGGITCPTPANGELFVNISTVNMALLAPVGQQLEDAYFATLSFIQPSLVPLEVLTGRLVLERIV